MDCTVCGRPVVGTANVCSTSCLLKAGPVGGKNQGGAKRAAAGILNKVALAAMTGRPDPWEDVPMIVVQHRWMRNRNIAAGATNLSFNDKGLAYVRDISNARLDVETYVRFSKGLAQVVDPEPAPPPAPEPKKEKVKEKKAVPVAAEEEKPKTTKKTSKKRPPGKKVVSKKKE